MPGPHDLELLRRVWGIAALLTEEADPRKLVPLILDQAIALVGAQRGFAIVLTGQGSEAAFEVAAARNLELEDIAQPRFEVSRSIVRRVAQTGKAELIDDTENAETTRMVTSIKALNLRSVLCVPLRAHGRTLGVVYLDHLDVRAQFDETSLAATEAFAVPAAVALDAAWRMKELALRLETIERLRADLSVRYRARTRELDVLRDEAAHRMLAPGAGADLLGIVARSGGMRRVLEMVRKAAPSEASVLIVGESGVGKELLARAIHALSPRSKGPFFAENCGALADPLIESELFGHEAGAFTGAVEARAGIFEAARGGTLFLDEVGEMSPALQVKVLRVLQERAVRRVGGDALIPVDVRVVAATNRDLEGMIARGAFRGDLLYRLDVVRLNVPPLRERPEDVPALLDGFLEAAGVRPERLEPEARDLLLAYPWPGNARELENEVRRLAVFAGTDTLRATLLSPAIFGLPASPRRQGPTAATRPGRVRPLKELEKEMIELALEEAEGNKTLAARLLGIPKTSLYRRLEKHGDPAEDGGE